MVTVGMEKQAGIWRVLGQAGGYHLLVLALCANVVEGVGKAMVAVRGGGMLDAFLAADHKLAVRYMGIILVYILLLGAGIFAKDSLLGIYQEKGMLRLRRKTVAAISRARFSWLDERHSGELSARVSGDLAALGTALRPVLIMGISLLVAEGIAIGFLFAINWRLTLVMFAAVPATMLLQWLYSKPITRYRAENQDAVGKISAVLYDTLGSFESVKSLRLEDVMQRRFAAAQDEQRRAALRENRVVALLTPLAGLGQYVPQFVLVFAGGLYVIAGAMSLGQMAVFLTLSASAVYTVGGVAEMFGSIRQLCACADRLTELWDVQAESEGGAADLPQSPADALAFDGVWFGYGQGDTVLQDIRFRVPRGALVAIVGESGCGKSTVMKLAASLYSPRRGRVSVLGRVSGEWELGAMRRQIAYVAQDTYLFPGTLRENVTAGHEVDDGSLDEILAAAQLDSFVQAHPAGMDTQVGERGAMLSGGQRQRIAIARALGKRAELLLLDEATSALDSSTEAAVMRSIMQLPNRPAVLMITHKMRNAREADLILVMQGGRICQQGTHGELAGIEGVYRRLLSTQADEVEF